MARTFAAQRRITARILATPEHQAYDWALTKVASLPQQITTTSRETADDWWALLRTVWKVKLGLDARQPQDIAGSWVDV